LVFQSKKEKKLEEDFEKLMNTFGEMKDFCLKIYSENVKLKEKIKSLESKDLNENI